MSDEHDDTFDRLLAHLERAVVDFENPGARKTVHGVEEAMVSTPPEVIIGALTTLAANFAVQSGDYPAQRDRRELADKLRSIFLAALNSFQRQYDEALTKLGPRH